MISPTPGRIVWFTPSVDPTSRPHGFEYHDIKQPCAATVAYVWGDRMVNLLVLDQSGKPFAHTSVTLLQDDDRKPEQGRFASWMPYQVGQAKKHEGEGLNAAAAERAKAGIV